MGTVGTVPGTVQSPAQMAVFQGFNGKGDRGDRMEPKRVRQWVSRLSGPWAGATWAGTRLNGTWGITVPTVPKSARTVVDDRLGVLPKGCRGRGTQTPENRSLQEFSNRESRHG